MARLASLHPEAAAEVETAYDWYAERSADAARGFLRDFELALDRVLESPTRWPEIAPGRRRYVLPRYPFVLIYRMARSGGVEVIALAHAKRRPGYWKS